MSRLELMQRLRPDCSRRMAACADGGEIRRSLPIHDGLGHDGARRISGAQKKHVVSALRHRSEPQLQHVGPQHALLGAGLTARMKALTTFPSTWGAIFSTSIPCPARNT